jgi:hypothetical protein
MIYMSHSQCPNIKKEILALRTKIEEMERLRTGLLLREGTFQENIEVLQVELMVLIYSIYEKIDIVANNTILPNNTDESWEYEIVDNYFNGRAWVRNLDGTVTHIGIDRKPIYSVRYVEASDYSKGIAQVTGINDEEFYIDLDGNRLP